MLRIVWSRELPANRPSWITTSQTTLSTRSARPPVLTAATTPSISSLLIQAVAVGTTPDRIERIAMLMVRPRCDSQTSLRARGTPDAVARAFLRSSCRRARSVCGPLSGGAGAGGPAGALPLALTKLGRRPFEDLWDTILSSRVGFPPYYTIRVTA